MLTRICIAAGTAAACVLGVIGLLTLPPLALPFYIGVGMLAGTGCVHMQQVRGAFPDRSLAVVGIGGAVIAFAACIVVAGLVVATGALGALILTLLLTGSGAWLWWRRRPEPAGPDQGTRGHGPDQGTRGHGRVRAADAVRAVQQRAVAALPSIRPGSASTQELCAAWCRSYWVLRDLPAGPHRYRLVSIRASLLDELERRDPAGFHRWLDTGARAGSDPSRFLTTSN